MIIFTADIAYNTDGQGKDKRLQVFKGHRLKYW